MRVDWHRQRPKNSLIKTAPVLLPPRHPLSASCREVVADVWTRSSGGWTTCRSDHMEDCWDDEKNIHRAQSLSRMKRFNTVTLKRESCSQNTFIPCIWSHLFFTLLYLLERRPFSSFCSRHPLGVSRIARDQQAHQWRMSAIFQAPLLSHLSYSISLTFRYPGCPVQSRNIAKEAVDFQSLNKIVISCVYTDVAVTIDRSDTSDRIL